jgi:hypothetical protein
MISVMQGTVMAIIRGSPKVVVLELRAVTLQGCEEDVKKQNFNDKLCCVG